MTTDVDGFLLLLRAEPSLMPAAPKRVTAEDLEDRRRRSRPCLRCGQPAALAHIAFRTSLGPRWLDLCHVCTYWIRTGATPQSMTEGL